MDLAQTRGGMGVAPWAGPLFGPDEGDALAAAGPEAEQALARGRLQHAAPARPQDLEDARRVSLADRLDDLLSDSRSAIELLTDFCDQLQEVLLAQVDQLEPGLIDANPASAHRRRIHGEVVSGDEVKGAAHEPGLHEALVLPERVTNVLDGAVCAHAIWKLSRRHQLRLGADDVSDHSCELFLGRPSEQVVAPKSKGIDLGPAQVDCDWRLGLQIKPK